MRAAILTFQESNNIGALLQAYALQHTLTALCGESCDILNYHSAFKEKQYSVNLSKGLLVFLNSFLSSAIRRKTATNTARFKRRYLNITRNTYHSSNDMLALNAEYGAFVCGSDQIWNATNTGLDEVYFLDFVTDASKRVPYAPSIGLSEIPGDLVDFYRRNLARFRYLSIREATGQRAIAQITGRTAELVLDPTLLLDQHEWSRIAAPVVHQPSYVFVYYIGYVPYLITFAKELARKKGLNVVLAARTARDYILGCDARVVSPTEFVSYVAFADTIVTNSFHGTAFSVNLEKGFYAFGNKGSMAQTNPRITDFLDLLGLSSRYIDSESTARDVLGALHAMSYEGVSGKLAAQREASLGYLRSALDRQRGG